jgi:tol-pal system protein YbgF
LVSHLAQSGARWALMLVMALLAAWPAQAALFEDDEARKAILDLRQRMESNRKAIEASLNEALSNQAAEQRRQLEEQRRGSEELNGALRRSLLELSGQIETLRGEIARLRGQNEQLARDISEVQRRQKDLAEVSMKVDERMRKLEPTQVSVDGRDFLADPAEKAEYEAALAVFRKGQFVAAQAAFAEFGRRYPSSGYRPSALYWLGNSQYATREYKEAITSFRAFLTAAPEHARAPDALLSVANCQIELKDLKAARKTLSDVGALYAQSEAAQAAKERLSRLK